MLEADAPRGHSRNPHFLPDGSRRPDSHSKMALRAEVRGKVKGLESYKPTHSDIKPVESKHRLINREMEDLLAPGDSENGYRPPVGEARTFSWPPDQETVLYLAGRKDVGPVNEGIIVDIYQSDPKAFDRMYNLPPIEPEPQPDTYNISDFRA